MQTLFGPCVALWVVTRTQFCRRQEEFTMNRRISFRLVTALLMTATAMTASSALAAENTESALFPVTPFAKETVAEWGGGGISIEVFTTPATYAQAASTYALVKLNCGRGVIRKVVKDEHGGFAGFGTVSEKSPELVGAEMPAHFVGVAENGVMTLMIVVDKERGNPAVYLLKKGETGHIGECQ